MIRRTAAALLFAVASPVAAQQMVPVGARVAVVLGEDRRQVSNRFGPKTITLRGDVTGETADSLFIRLRVTGTLGINKAGIRDLFVSRGAPSRGRSLVIEGIGGAFIGALEAAIFYHAFNHDRGLFGATSRGQAVGYGAAYGGAFFGLIGFVFPVEYWRRIPLD